MKVPFKYEKTIIQSAMKKHHGIKNIDLDSPSKVEETISIFLIFLGLDKTLTVHDAFGEPYSYQSGYEKLECTKIRFSLAATDKTSSEQFQMSIKKFQEHINITTKTKKSKELETEVIIKKINEFISTVPSNIKISMSSSPFDEATLKAECNFPSYWFFYKPTKYNYGTAIFSHLKQRLNITSNIVHFSYGHCLCLYAY